MADLVITAANVKPGTDAVVEQVKWGATVTAGQPVYQNATDRKFYPADANGTGTREVYGIALSGGAVDQVGVVQRSGRIAIGATVVVGETYVLSGTAGGVAPVADITSGSNVVHLGVAATATEIKMSINNTAIVKA